MDGFEHSAASVPTRPSLIANESRDVTPARSPDTTTLAVSSTNPDLAGIADHALPSTFDSQVRRWGN